ncbi:MAG: 2-keto-3-deoxygluconate permease [Tissierellaceae bacterium]|nr:2-keto-3-deoxygluconate permease [Tissierellaceae bacterium]
MKILKGVQKVPGGLMVIPLLMGALINTFVPGILEIGGFTTALFKNSATALIALFVLCNGAQINVKQAGVPLYKGVVLTIIKFLIGAVIGWVIGKTWGNAGILGLTPLALIGAITNSNGGMYAALAGQYGDSTDVGAISILSLNDGPFFTMIAFGITGLANIPFMAFIAVLVPILIGFVLGNLDEDLREFLNKGTVLLIPFFAFPLGAALDFRTIIAAGGSGLLLGILCTILTGFAGYYVMRLFSGKPRAVGAAIGTTAGNAVGTPAALALADPSLEPFVASATAQIAAAVIVTAILCPLLVSYLDKRDSKKKLASS